MAKPLIEQECGGDFYRRHVLRSIITAAWRLLRHIFVSGDILV